MKRLRRAEQVERNRGLVLEAARRVFLDKGYSGATLEGIADEAGFSKGVVYSQFESKGDMFLALLARRIEERAELNARITQRMAGADVVRALLRAAARDAEAEQRWGRVLIEFRIVASRDPDLNRRYAEAHAEAVSKLAALLGEAHVRAERVPAVPVRAMAELIFAVGSGITLERTADPSALPIRVVERMLVAALGMEEAS